ncbi:MAG: hypothetical protein WCO61_10865 [Alphaproteobacteria bacterium]
MASLLSIESLESDRRFIEKQISEASDNPWGTSLLMWQNRLAELDEQMQSYIGNRSNYATVAVIFEGSPVIGSIDIKLDFTTKALDCYQKLVSSALSAKIASGELSKRGPLRGADKSQLFIRDLVRGSMGFILEELPPEQQEILPSNLKAAVEGSTELLRSLNNASDGDFQLALQSNPPRLIEAVKKFASVLYKSGASTRILGDEKKVTLSLDDIDRLSKRLADVDIVEEIETIEGKLLGILPDKAEFEFERFDDSETAIHGTLTDDLIEKYTTDSNFNNQYLLKPVLAVFKNMKTIKNGRVASERRSLEQIGIISKNN